MALVSGESSEKDGGETEKSLLARAEEALANAMLKAFMELNDPGKNKEEFEEKLHTCSETISVSSAPAFISVLGLAQVFSLIFFTDLSEGVFAEEFLGAFTDLWN